MTQPSTTTAVERNLRRGSGDPDALLQIRIGAKDKRKQRERNCSGRTSSAQLTDGSEIT